MAYIPPGRRGGNGSRGSGPGAGVRNTNPKQRRTGSAKASKVGTHHVVRKAGKAPSSLDDATNIMHIPKVKKTKPARVPGKIVKAATRTVATVINQAVSNYVASSVGGKGGKPGSTHHIVQKAKSKVPHKAKSFFAKLKLKAKAVKRKLFG